MKTTDLNESNILTLFGSAIAASATGFAEVVDDRDLLESLVSDDDKDEKFSDFISRSQFDQIFLIKFRPIRLKFITLAGWRDQVDIKLFLKQPTYNGSIKDYYRKHFLGALIKVTTAPASSTAHAT